MSVMYAFLNSFLHWCFKLRTNLRKINRSVFEIKKICSSNAHCSLVTTSSGRASALPWRRATWRLTDAYYYVDNCIKTRSHEKIRLISTKLFCWDGSDRSHQTLYDSTKQFRLVESDLLVWTRLYSGTCEYCFSLHTFFYCQMLH
jgi:hypothetical protein